MIEILIVYLLIGTVVSALFFAAHLFFRASLEKPFPLKLLIATLPLNIILWPMYLFVLFQERSLKSVLEYKSYDVLSLPSNAELEKRRERILELWNNPPPCGKYIYTTSRNSRFCDNTEAMFVFESEQVFAHFAHYLKDEVSIYDHAAAIKKWVAQADSSQDVCSCVPEEWDDFRDIERDLIAKGIGQCFCKQCNKIFENNSLVIKQEALKIGWNFERIECPNGHSVIITETMHILSSKSDD
ncbi:hypothetical protein [Alteromonas sp. AMM-1]|uniref:hypothetical protein n=1 Tax=Alteromonas sp. AMM-1 TaxID=3394233 RepID=UPI0039A5EDE6